jgi:hypothetical protein
VQQTHTEYNQLPKDQQTDQPKHLPTHPVKRNQQIVQHFLSEVQTVSRPQPPKAHVCHEFPLFQSERNRYHRDHRLNNSSTQIPLRWTSEIAENVKIEKNCIAACCSSTLCGGKQ